MKNIKKGASNTNIGQEILFLKILEINFKIKKMMVCLIKIALILLSIFLETGILYKIIVKVIIFMIVYIIRTINIETYIVIFKIYTTMDIFTNNINIY